jgi:ABC-type branched-subunit amino acid transport system ATPase component
MLLQKILSTINQPVKPEIIKEIITYMKNMPKEQEALVLQCAEHIDKSQNLGDVLAVVHALNEGEFLLKCRDDDFLEADLSSEFDKILGEKKKEDHPLQ